MNGNDKLKQIIGNARNVLVVSTKSVNLDILCSQLVLSQIIKATNDKRVDVLINDKFATSFNQVVSNFPDLDIKNTILPQLSVITINHSADNFEGIEWKKDNNKLKLFIRTKEGSELEEKDIAFAKESEHYDLIVTIGLSDVNDLGELYTNNKEFFNDTSILNISIKDVEKETGDYEVRDIKSSTYSELVYDMIGSMKFNINKTSATTLLLGVYSGTLNFSQVKNPKTFDSAAKLTALGGDIDFINSFLQDNDNNSFILRQSEEKKQPILEEEIQTTIKVEEVKEPVQPKKSKPEDVKAKQPAQATTASQKTQSNKAQTQPKPVIQQQTQSGQVNNPSPLQKAKSIPQMPTGNEQNQGNFGMPNFVQPPPINPTKTTSFAPLAPKRKG